MRVVERPAADMDHIVVGGKVLVRDAELHAGGFVGGTVSCVYTGPGGEKLCNVVIPSGRVRVYQFASGRVRVRVYHLVGLHGSLK